MTKLEQVVQSITKQQGKAKAGSAVWCVGEQLKDLLGMLGEEAAAVVAEEIDSKGHGIADCEKKIAAFASAHKEGSVGFCGPKDADRIVREFYGLGNFAPADGAGVLTSSVSADGADSFPKGEALETKKPFEWGTLDLEDFL